MSHEVEDEDDVIEDSGKTEPANDCSSEEDVKVIETPPSETLREAKVLDVSKQLENCLKSFVKLERLEDVEGDSPLVKRCSVKVERIQSPDRNLSPTEDSNSEKEAEQGISPIKPVFATPRIPKRKPSLKSAIKENLEAKEDDVGEDGVQDVSKITSFYEYPTLGAENSDRSSSSDGQASPVLSRILDEDDDDYETEVKTVPEVLFTLESESVAPTRKAILESCDDLGLPQERHQGVFCSTESDVPDKGKNGTE